MRRICLFAGYDKNAKIQDYVIYYIKKLAQISDVYYMGNGKIPPDELFKIAPFTRRLFAKSHDLRDFGSWYYLINRLGWNKIEQYDEVIFCNDSVYGPLFDLENIFLRMERKGFDFWSMTADYDHKYHLHRYFMVFNNDIVKNHRFQEFWKKVPQYNDAGYCEYELTPLLTELGYIGNSYIRNYKQTDILQNPRQILSEYPVPFIKIKSFLPANKYTAGSGLALRYKMRAHTDYDTALISRNIAANHYPQTIGQRLATFSGI